MAIDHVKQIFTHLNQVLCAVIQVTDIDRQVLVRNFHCFVYALTIGNLNLGMQKFFLFFLQTLFCFILLPRRTLKHI